MRSVHTILMPGQVVGIPQTVQVGGNPKYYGGRLTEEGIELWVEGDMDTAAAVIEELIAIGGMFIIPPEAEYVASVHGLTSRGPVVFHVYRSTARDLVKPERKIIRLT